MLRIISVELQYLKLCAKIDLMQYLESFDCEKMNE